MMSMIERVFQGAKAEGMRSHFLFNQVAQNGKKTCHHCNRNPQRQKATGANFCEGLPALLSVSSGPAESNSTKFNQVAERKQTAPTERINLGSLKLHGWPVPKIEHSKNLQAIALQMCKCINNIFLDNGSWLGVS